MLELIQILKQYVESSNLYKSFDYGEDIELNLNGDKQYPQLFLEEPILITINENDYKDFEFALLGLDIESELYKDDTNKIDKIEKDAIQLKEYLYDNGYLINTFSLLSLRNFSSDMCCGFRMELAVKRIKKC